MSSNISDQFNEHPLPHIRLNPKGEILEWNKSFEDLCQNSNNIKFDDVFEFENSNDKRIFYSHIGASNELTVFTVSAKTDRSIWSIYKFASGETRNVYYLIPAWEKGFKTSFIANLNHEMKAPLARMGGILTVMEKEYRLDSDLRDYIDILKICQNRLLMNVQNAIEYSKLNSGKVPLQLNMVDVNAILEGLDDEFQPSALLKNLKFIVSIPSTKTQVKGTENIISELIKIGVQNAIKFTTVGHVKVRILKDYESTSVVIEDSGPGMSNEFTSQAFELLTQESSGLNRAHSGLGIGLPLAKKYAQSIGAELLLNKNEFGGLDYQIRFND